MMIFKLVKQQSNLSFFILKKDSWQLTEATIGASAIEWYTENPIYQSTIVKQESFLRTFLNKRFIGFDPERQGLFTLGETFREFFEIISKNKQKHRINLNRSKAALNVSKGSQKITVYAKENTMPDKRNKLWTTQNTYEFESGFYVECRSLKPF